MSNNPILNLMLEAAQKSAVIIRENFYTDNDSDEKQSNKDIVTKTDKFSQKTINEHLTNGMIELGFLVDSIGFIEEESQNDVVKEHTFVVDPIDGTSNFSAGIPNVCISIAYAKNKELILGVVLNPLSGDLYWGEKGKGSFLKNGLVAEMKLETIEREPSAWMVAGHFNGMEVADEQFANYKKLYPHVRGLRNLGSLTLDVCFAAQGAMDLVMNLGAYFWDLAAARVILEEAGGKIYAPDGSELVFDWLDTRKRYENIVCHPNIKDKVFELLK
jgi:myo-inositol-1(or 4)-monophosphatase